MNNDQPFQDENYGQIIKTIKKRERRALFVWIGGIVLVALLGMILPSLTGSGLPLALSILLLGLLFALYLFMTGYARAPITTALDIECDPHKYRALVLYQKKRISNEADLASQLFSACFFAGEFEEALHHAEVLAEKGGRRYALSALFDKIRVYYFTADSTHLEECVNEFYSYRTRPMKESERAQYNVLVSYVDIMVALSCNDTDALKEISPRLLLWRDTNIVRIQTDYFQGVSAYIAGEYGEAEYKLSRVCEFGARTFLGRLSEGCLDRIKAQGTQEEEKSPSDE